MRPLQPGDEIRVIAPSYSAATRQDQRSAERATERLESLGYKVTFGKYLASRFHLGTASAEERAEDFNSAYKDARVKAIMAFTGGWSANEILPKIDWELVRANPKPLCGFSDITVLLNAVYAKTGAIGFLGPNFSTLGRMISWRYTLNNFDAMLRQQLPAPLKRSKEWGVTASKRYKTRAWSILQPGEAEAVAIGGNLGTLYLLQGTEYQPAFNEPFILLAEDDDESGTFTAREFSRRLESLLQLPLVRQNLRGVLVGRFQPSSRVTMPDIVSIIASKRLGDIPVVAGVDFGHTIPMLTFPIGGKVRLTANGRRAEVSIVSS
ncbi:MAG TPA: S66 peptidase family protein [Candidatus Saccharimonadales bacterium]|nr:S66 peptidase family protein [Candidatus Saccharimonadales bacterium]